MYRRALVILTAVCLIAVFCAGCGGKGADDPSNTSALTGESNVTGAEAVLPSEMQNADESGAAGQAGGAAGGSASGTATGPLGNGSGGAAIRDSVPNNAGMMCLIFIPFIFYFSVRS